MKQISSILDYGIVGNCQSVAAYKCLHLNVRGGKLFFAFYVNAVAGSRLLQNNTWHHFAFAFSCNTFDQRVYLDGILCGKLNATRCFEGVQINVTIGAAIVGTVRRFDGFIDQLSFISRMKTSDEILDDATLTAYFSFDRNSTMDEGPLSLNTYSIGNISAQHQGRRSGSLLISNVSDSYLRIENLVKLGISSEAFSFSLWINPIEILQSTLIHVSTSLTGLASWCLPLLGLNANGSLIAILWNDTEVVVHGPTIFTHSWTFAAITYSSLNGFKLYINGSIYNSSMVTYTASEQTNHVLIGSPAAGMLCRGSSLIGGQYYGFVDELRIYSRELTSSEISMLSQ